MTTTPSAPHPDDARCAELIIDDLRECNVEALRTMIDSFKIMHPNIDPRVALITLTHCDISDEGEVPPLTPGALDLAVSMIDPLL